MLYDSVKELLVELGEDGFACAASTTQNEDNDVIIIIGLTGDYKGFLSFAANRQSAEDLSRRLSERVGLSFRADTQTIKAAMGEFLNMISGKLVNSLAELNISCNITPPTFFFGNGLRNDYSDTSSAASLLFSGQFGTFTLDFNLKK